MKKSIIIIGLAIFGVLTISSCGNNASKDAKTEQAATTKTIYTCEMHPSVVSDKPGKCPICGMDLIKKEVPITDSLSVKAKPDSTKK